MKSTKVKKPIKVAIFGSCTTRDIFNSKFNHNYKEYFNVVSFQNQTSIMSLVSPSVSFTDDSLYPLKGWDKSSIKAELEKLFLVDIIETKPDILIVDFFADARFKTIATKNSYITVNEWKTVKSNYYKEISKFNDPFIPDETQLKEAMQLFYEFMQKYLPNTKIVLNQARGVKSYTDKDGEEKFFNKKFVNTLNKRWDMLDNLFIEIVNPIKIDVMNPTVKGYIDHLWSIGYVHYTPNFYNNFLKTLIYVTSKDQVEFIKSSLAHLVPTSLFPEEKLSLIEDIRSNYISLSYENKDKIDTWLSGRYKQFLEYLVNYNKNIHHYVKFISYAFRGGIKKVIARDVPFSEFLIEPVISRRIFAEEAKSAYAHLLYGNIMYHNFITSTYPHEHYNYFNKAYETLTFTYNNGKTDYLKNRSAYFLANLYAGNKEFKTAFEWYLKAIDTEKPAPNIYSLPFLMLMRSIGLNGTQLFEKINTIFNKDSYANLDFWIYLRDSIDNITIKNNIYTIIDNGNFNGAKTKLNVKKIESFIETVNLYINYNFDYSKDIQILDIQKMYRNSILKDEAKSNILFKMANIFANKRKDLSRAILMASESITMHIDRDKLMFISNTILNNFSIEIRRILSENEYYFKNETINNYCAEQSRKVAAWKRFVKEGFVTGRFDEEVDFLEYLLVHTQNDLLIKILKTRLAYLYYVGSAGISEDSYITPNIEKSREYFLDIDISENPLVKKYIQHPRLAIYQDMEQFLDKKSENYLFFENKKSKELLIVFSCAGSYSRYTQLKVFYEKNKTNVLFLNNISYNWYHGEEWKKIKKIIDNIALEHFSKENIICYFGSMGGYAALRVGLTYNFRTIVFNPQIDLNIWIKHRPSISVRLNKEKKLYNLQEFDISSYEKTPIYYATSSAIEDVEAFKIFISKISQCKEGFFIIEKIEENIHEGIFGHIYKNEQQSAILNIAAIQKKYFGDKNILPFNIDSSFSIFFWEYILDAMEVRVLIQIKNNTIFYSCVKNNFLKPLYLQEIKTT